MSEPSGTTTVDGLPAGTVTFLLSDVEGSTHMWQHHPGQARDAMRRHDELINALLARHRGLRPRDQGEGDSVLAVFRKAGDALACALDIQQGFAAEDWPEGCRLRLRVALHTGETEVVDGNYRGAAVIRGARIRALGHGGQILASETTVQVIRDELPPRVSLVDLGVHPLKGLTHSEHVWQVQHPELDDEFPPLASPADPRPTRRRLIGLSLAAVAALVLLAVWAAGMITESSDSATTATSESPDPGPAGQSEPQVDISSVEVQPDLPAGAVRYRVTGAAIGVQTPPYEIRVLARDPEVQDIWLWSPAASVDADGRWAETLTVPAAAGDPPALALSAVVILNPATGVDPPPVSALPPTSTGETPRTTVTAVLPPSLLEQQLATAGPSADGVVAVSRETVAAP